MNFDELTRNLASNVSLVRIGEGIPADKNPHYCIGVGDLHEAPEVVRWMSVSGISHVIQTSHPEVQRELRIATELINDPKKALTDPLGLVFDQLQLKDLRGGNIPESVGFWEFILTNSKQKDELLVAMRSFLTQVPRSSTITDAVCIIADEYATNALYNAPFHSPRSKYPKNPDRSEKVLLDTCDAAKVFVAHNPDWLMIGCEDPFGSLNPHVLMEHLSKGYEKGLEAVMNMGRGGAHIGTRMVLEMSVGIYILVEDGVRTFVGSTVPLGKSYKSLGKMPKSIHIMFVDSNYQHK